MKLSLQCTFLTLLIISTYSFAQDTQTLAGMPEAARTASDTGSTKTAGIDSTSSLQPVMHYSRESLNFFPLIANYQEPRVGFTRLVQEQRIRLDIGNSIDLLLLRGNPEHREVTAVGVDFFTWTSLGQEADFHFPVSAVDYLFGINATHRRQLSDDIMMSMRFRWSHISAHLVDGSYDKTEEEWIDGRDPAVYSREFVDLITAFEYSDVLRLYAGVQYVYHIDPPDLGPWGAQGGIEISKTGVCADWMHLYAAYDFRLSGVGAYVGNNSVQAGVKFGKWRGSGLNVFIVYYNGMSQHGEYYDQRWSYWGPGINFDF